MKIGLARLGNFLYDWTPSIYGPLYSTYKRISDRQERELFSSWLRPGDVVLDVGANIGVYACFFARRVGLAGKVFAFEPEDKNLGHLSRAAQPYPQIEIVKAAVLDRTGPHRLFVSPDLNVDHRTYDAGDNRSSIEIPGISLDEFVPNPLQVSVIKMDIQGAEMGALRGARRLLSDSPRLSMIIEFWPFGLTRAGERPMAMVDLLRSAGFTVSQLGAKPFSALDPDDPNDYVNLVATRGISDAT